MVQDNCLIISSRCKKCSSGNYIFHCANAGTLSLCVEKADNDTPMDWAANDRPTALQTHAADNEQDAS